MQHLLKTWPPFFQDIVDNKKSFEFRKNDRDFLKGDTLFLNEWSPLAHKHTGRSAKRIISYIVKGGQFGIPEGYCILGFNSPSQRQSQEKICSLNICVCCLNINIKDKCPGDSCIANGYDNFLGHNLSASN